MLVKRIATLEASNKQLLSLSGTRVGTPASDRLEPDAPMYSKLQGDWGRKHAETLFQMAIRSATGGEVIKSSTSGRRGATPKAFQEGIHCFRGVCWRQCNAYLSISRKPTDCKAGGCKSRFFKSRRDSTIRQLI